MGKQRSTAAWMAPIGLGVTLLLNGCSDATDGRFRTVSEEEVSRAAEVTAPITPPERDDQPAPATALQHDTARIDQSPAQTPSRRSPEDVADTLAPPIRLLIPDRRFSPEGPGRVLRVSFDDFDLEQVLGVTFPTAGIVEHFPDWLNELDGRRVRVRGFMAPTFREDDLAGFVLARDTEVCCFGPRGKIYHLVKVSLQEDTTTNYIHMRPFDVEGVFRITPVADGDELLLLYQLEAAVVIDD